MSLNPWESLYNNPQCPLAGVHNTDFLEDVHMSIRTFEDLLEYIPSKNNVISFFIHNYNAVVSIEGNVVRINLVRGIQTLLSEFYEAEPKLQAFVEAKGITDEQVRLSIEDAQCEARSATGENLTFKDLAQIFIDKLELIGEDNPS